MSIDDRIQMLQRAVEELANGILATEYGKDLRNKREIEALADSITTFSEQQRLADD